MWEAGAGGVGPAVRKFGSFEPAASIVSRSPPPLSGRHDDFDRLVLQEPTSADA
jgi:hypothetical protein